MIKTGSDRWNVNQMRYDDDLIEKDVYNWATKNFEQPIKVHTFKSTFVITTKNEVVNINKDSGTVEVVHK